MTSEEFKQLLSQTQKKPSSKHGNIRVYIYEDGYISYGEKLNNHGKLSDRFDSIKEYTRYGDLFLMQKSGLIQNLRRQVPFLLHAGYKDREGKAHRAISYVADFVYEENGMEVIEDVKGYDKVLSKYRKTSTFALKWNLLQATYPDKEFRLF